MNELEKQTPAEETATPAEAVNAAENNPETCTVEKECVETESPSEELAAAADSIEQKADLRRQSLLPALSAAPESACPSCQ